MFIVHYFYILLYILILQFRFLKYCFKTTCRRN